MITDVKELHSNEEINNMLNSMEDKMHFKGKFGYAIARNIRTMRETGQEFMVIRDSLIEELGEDYPDHPGSKIISFGTEACDEYERRIKEFSEIEHEVTISKYPYNELPEDVTAKDILELEWMLIEE